jgi:hypothetical protein
VSFILATGFPSAAQVRRQSTAPVLVPLEVSLKAGSDAYDAKVEGSCTHAPRASIYGILSEMWSVRHQDEGRSMQLTLWKPADGSAQMFSLSVNRKKSSTVSTVRGGQTAGVGTVTFAPSGKGGTFTIDAKDQMVETISGTVKCEGFTSAIAEGGN